MLGLDGARVGAGLGPVQGLGPLGGSRARAQARERAMIAILKGEINRLQAHAYPARDSVQARATAWLGLG